MKKITISDPHRQKHFDFFREMSSPHFSLVAHVPFGRMRAFIRDEGLHFTSTVVYLIARSANAVPQLRWRIRGEEVVEHEVVHPSFTVETAESDAFSFCYVEYQSGFAGFQESARQAIRRMHTNPSFEDVPGRDDYLFLSAIPWVHFTSMTHAMAIGSMDSVPRIVWGKLGPGSEGTMLPLGIQAHHGVVDGKHAGQFYRNFEALCAEPSVTLGTSGTSAAPDTEI